MNKALLLSVSVSLSMVACQSDDSPANQYPREDIDLTRSEHEITTSGNDFAFQLFARVDKSEEKENFFISPLSASLALSMTANGAAGTTLDEMKTTLGFADYTLDELNTYYNKLVKGLLKVDPRAELGIANSIWIKEGFDVKQSFVDVNKQKYDADVRFIEFTPSALDIINGWCADKTNGKIDKILDKINDDARMYLLNALYFKGGWTSKFDKANTRKEDFTTANGEKVPVDMMSQQAVFMYNTNKDFQMVELPYGNQAFSMVVILPHENKTLNDVIPQINATNWEKWNSSMSGRHLSLKLPRFKQEYSKELNDDLKAMGMNLPFNPLLADFGDMAEFSKLYIYLVKQNTFIEVNEEGTQAAAVTVVEMDLTSAGVEPIIPEFHVNHPFIYLIKEKSTGAILFMGKMGNL